MLNRLAVVLTCAVLVFTSLLFFFRTRAVFNRNTWVTAFFAGLWLAVLGVSLAFIVATLEPVPVNPASNATAMCLRPSINPYAAATTIIPLINDTLVFLAITWRLSRNSYKPYTLKSGIRLLIFGDYLPVFSKALLRDGQAYYLLALLGSMFSCRNISQVVLSTGLSLPWISCQWSCYSILRTLRFFEQPSWFRTSHWWMSWPVEHSGIRYYLKIRQG